MAIGDVRASGGIAREQVDGAAARISAQYGAGVSSAIQDLVKAGIGFAQSQEDIANVFDRRAMASKSVAAETAFVELQGRRAQRFTELSRSESADPSNITSTYDSELEGEEKAFLDKLDPRLREEYTAKLQQDRVQRRGAMFRSSLEMMDSNDSKLLTAGLNNLGTYLKSGQLDLDGAQAQWDDLVGKSGLPPAVKQEMALQGRQTLQQLQFGTDVEMTSRGFGTTGGAVDGSDVVAAGLGPTERAVLNAIASTESPGYNVINGGGTFDDYSDHPRQYVSKNDSTAAGRYQFIGGTWDLAKAGYEQATGVKVPDFSPEWQDRVALFWAQDYYDKHRPNGAPSFQQIMAAPDRQNLAGLSSVLGAQWDGVKRHSADYFANHVLGTNGIQRGGTGPAVGPNPWTDQRYSDIDLGTKVTLANSATAAVSAKMREAAAQAANDRKKLLEDIENAGYSSGDLSTIGAIRQQYPGDVEAERRYTQGVRSRMEVGSTVAEVAGKLQAGELLGTRDQKGYAEWFGQASMQGLAMGDPEAYRKLGAGVQASRQLPEGASKMVEAALRNPQTARPALEFLSMLDAGDANVINRSGFSDEAMAQLALYQRYAQLDQPDAAFERYSQALGTKQALNLTNGEVTKAADDFFKGWEVTSVWDTFMPMDQPRLPLDDGSRSKLTSDARQFWQDGYRLTGTADGAQAYMEAGLKKNWGPSSTGSTRALMRHPPEKYYQDTNAGRALFQQNVLNELQRNAADLNLSVPSQAQLPRTSGNVFGYVPNSADMVGQNFFALVPDDITDKEVRGGKLPTYRLMAHDRRGGVVMLPDRVGGQAYFDVGAAQERQRAEQVMSQTQAESQQTIDIQRGVADVFNKMNDTAQGRRNE